MARPHENLEAWKCSIDLVKHVYDATKAFPKEETYGLVMQMRRAAISIPSNIAEGAARSTQKEFAQFVSVARGSLSELETQMTIAVELGYLKRSHSSFALAERVSQLVGGLHRSLS
jgi:four helix bundle protein